MFDKDSPITSAAAEDEITGFLPNPVERHVALQQLVASADHAQAIAPEAWGVTLYRDMFRLNVGLVEVLVVHQDHIRLNCVGNLGMPPFVGPYFKQPDYRSVPEPYCAYVGPIDEYSTIEANLQSPHHEFIELVGRDRTGKPVRGSPHKKSHSEGLMAYARSFIMPPKDRIEQFHDVEGNSFHDRFQEWRTNHQDGDFLTLNSQTNANVHGVRCQHLGSGPPYFTSQDGFGSLTAKRKVCGPQNELLAWAKENVISVTPCHHCLRDKLIIDPRQLTRKELLAATKQLEMQGAFDPSGVKDARQRVISAIVRRRGQPAFRKNLFEAYKGRCAITGCDVESVLEAAHIIPYKGQETNHTANGLLLRADLHTLFDLQLVAVDEETMCLLVSPELDGTVYESFRGKRLEVSEESMWQPSREALEQHRRESGLSC